MVQRRQQPLKDSGTGWRMVGKMLFLLLLSFKFEYMAPEEVILAFDNDGPTKAWNTDTLSKSIY